MTAADAGRERELAIAAEQEEDWPWGVWTREALDRLWAEYGELIPWEDARDNQEISEEEAAEDLRDEHRPSHHVHSPIQPLYESQQESQNPGPHVPIMAEQQAQRGSRGGGMGSST